MIIIIVVRGDEVYAGNQSSLESEFVYKASYAEFKTNEMSVHVFLCSVNTCIYMHFKTTKITILRQCEFYY